MFGSALIIAPALGMQLTDLPTDVAMVSTASMPLSSAWVDANGEVVLQQHPVDKARKKEKGFTKSKQVCSVGTSLLQRVHDHSRKPGSGEKAGRTTSKEEHKQHMALLRSCRKECKEDSECMGFQLMGGTCESIYDLNVAETAKGEDCTRDSDCCFEKVIVLTGDGDDVIVNVAEDDDDDDYEEDDKEEMILLSSNSTPDFSEKHTGGACVGDYLREESSQTTDLSACKAACGAASSCSFLSFCPSFYSSCPREHANKCALYSSCTSKDTNHPGYMTYTKNTHLVTPTTTTPTPSGCVEPEGITHIKHAEAGMTTSEATPQTCSELRSKGFCSVTIVQTTCPCTCPPSPVVPVPVPVNPPDFSEKHTGGACKGGYLREGSGQFADLSACKASCGAASSCSFLSFCPSGTSSCQGTNANKCALYSYCTSSDTGYPGYTTYTKDTHKEACCPCVTSDDCAGGAFCCPSMKKCSYTGTACYANYDCRVR